METAQSIELQHRMAASSRLEYDNLCTRTAQEIGDDVWESGHGIQNGKKSIDEDLPPTDGGLSLPTAIAESVSIGHYTHAEHHRDGLFSEIYRATAPDGKLVALKVTNPSATSPPHDVEREIRVLGEASSPRIIPILDSFRQAGGLLVVVFPYKPTTLEEVLREKKVSERDTASILHDLFSALEHIHSIGLIHRDVKPSNLLLESPTGPAYLADFGTVWSPRDPSSEPADKKITDVGTTSYRPPELLFGYAAYDCKLDMWAAGCVAAEALLTPSKPLFDSGSLGSELALIQSIFKNLGTPTLETWPEATKFPDWGKMDFRVYPRQTWATLLPTASESARDLVSKLVCFESNSRMNATEALSHPYLTGGTDFSIVSTSQEIPS